MYQEKHLEQKAGTCGVSETSLDKLGPRTLEIYRAQPGVSSIIPVVQSQTPYLGIGIALCSPEASLMLSGWAWLSLVAPEKSHYTGDA